jgi:fructose-1,6-bisphosphatase II / sedoheptulose-1,7-bisphosphatase
MINLNNLILGITDATIAASIESHAFFGLGDEKAADHAAVEAMRKVLNKLPISGKVVIGEGERDEAPMLFIGEELGTGGHKIDIAVDPLEGTTILAQGKNNALSVIAIANAGDLLHAPDLYMDKIAIGFDFPERIIDLDNTIEQNLKNIALAKKSSINDLSVVILDRPRHQDLIAKVKEAGATIQLIQDGDIAAVIGTALGEADVYLGTGGAPEGVLACAALKTLGGQFCGKLLVRNSDEESRARRIGITDFTKQYFLDNIVKANAIFIATGVTDGWMLEGVKYNNNKTITQTMILETAGKKIRKITTSV